MAVKDYIKKSELQLSNTDDYKKLQEPTAANMKLVHDTIERLKKIAEDLKRNDPKSLILYLRPKIHKKVTSMTANL